MRTAAAYWIELTGTSLVLLWIFRNPTGFSSMMSALSGVTTNSVRTLQGR